MNAIFNFKKNLFFVKSLNFVHLVLICIFFLSYTTLNAQSTEEFTQGADKLIVYKDIPGLPSSDKYSIRVRSLATNNEWVEVFENYTYNRGFELTDIAREDGSFLIPVIQGYQKHTNRWSHTFGNIEMSNGQSVEVEIAAKNGLKIGGTDFVKATVHPAQKASVATVVNGKIYFIINNPAQVVIDINGQMDDYNAAINGGIGHPIHAVSLFANPILVKPSLSDTRVKSIEIGTDLQTINAIDPSSYDTMYFKPGIHDIGSGIKIHPGKNIYIPGDALVYGTFDNKGVPKGSFSRSGENITFFGYGTISGQKIPHYQYAYSYPNVNVTTDRVITIDDAINYKLHGITTIDNANHTTSIFSYGGGSIKWWKTITWRANGDGIGDYGDVEDCFIRTADDCSYVKGNRRRCTFWKDANAALFHMATIPENRITPIYIEDCDFLYTRLRSPVSFNGGGFQQRGEGESGQRNINVVARNLRFHDKLINMRIFALDSGTNGSSFDGILFQNISIEGMAPGNKQQISGSAISPWYGGIIFDNLTIGGTLVTPENHTQFFNTNAFVKDIWYRMPNYYSVTKNSNALEGSITVATTDTTQFAVRTSDSTFLEKSMVSVAAQAIPGYKFSSWSGDVVSTNNPIMVEMNSNKSVTANFEFVGFRTLTVNPATNGTVEVNPTGTSFTLNSTVTLTAKPAIGYKFNGWSGDLTNQNIVSPILMDADKTITPLFVKTNDFGINYGGDQSIAVDGTVYAACSGLSENTETTTNSITNTTDPVLYQSGKWAANLSYSYPVDNGKYEVVMKFAELSNASASVRRFNIVLEGTTVLSNFHISSEAGGNFSAIDKTFQTTVLDGTLNINLSRVSSTTNNAKISAISIKRIPETIPTFFAFPQYCYGESIPALPTISNNGIAGTWSPAVNNIVTTTYTFTPDIGQYATTATATITIGGVTTWNGTTWTNGNPNSSTKAIISGDYSQAINLTACSLDIIETAIVMVPTGYNFTISGKVTVAPTASFTLENNANLIQIGNSQNEGNATVKRNSTSLSRLDYTLWSAPVNDQQLQSFSRETSSNRFYSYNPTTNIYNSIIPSNNFAIGKGYLIRISNIHPNLPTIWTGSFIGIPTNGAIELPVAINTYNAIGNPYPSTISANAFIDANSLNEALYFWRKTNNASQTSYATYTKAGGTSNSGGLSSIVPNGIIQVGQGFIAKSASTTFTFDNAMRISNNENQFLKIKATERHRIWLNLTKDLEPVSQMMVSYMTGATSGIDKALDGRYFGDSPIALNSSIENQEFVIQAKGLPFEDTDRVCLSFKTDIQGNYNISIDHVDGLFVGNQQVFLKDNTLGVIHNLKEQGYSFTSSTGTFNTRFELIYKSSSVLGTILNELEANKINVYKENGFLKINTGATIIRNVHLFDIQGRLLFKQEGSNKTSMILKGFKATKQTLIVQITTIENKVFTKKVIL